MYSPETNDRELSPDAINRLWQHGAHEERLFHDRLNYFSLLEMGLLSVYGILYNKEPALGFLLPLTIVGFLFTLLWLFIQARHWSYCEHIVARQKRFIPDYKATIDAFSEKNWAQSFSVSRVLALSVPAVFGFTWVAFFIWLLVRPATVVDAESIISLERVLLAIVIAALAWLFFRMRRLERLLREKMKS